MPTPRPAPGSGQPSGAAEAALAQPAQQPAQTAPAAAKSIISGTVMLRESGDRPVQGVPVQITGPAGSASTTTGGNGSFSFGGLSAGAYTISIGLPGGLVALNGTALVAIVDGHNSGRVAFYLTRAERAPALATAQAAPPPTATPLPPTPTPLATATPKPLPTISLASGYSAPDQVEPGAPATRGGATSNASALPRIAASQGTRYAPGRQNPASINPTRDGSTTWLGVPFITQLDGSIYGEVNCGPASVAMVLGAFGIRANPDSIRNYVNDMSGVWGLNTGTSLDHLSRVARESGLEVHNLHAGPGRYLRWSTDLVRQEVEAGRPVVTLVKYRALPNHQNSAADFDHYIVIAGLSGDDFIYNDAAYTGPSAGYGLLISPADLLRAWDYSSIPRHGMAVGLTGSAQAQVASGEEIQGAAEALDLGEELPEELQGDLALGAELSQQGAYGGLSFKRMTVGDGTEPVERSVEEDPLAGGDTIELAAFIMTEPRPNEAQLDATSSESTSLQLEPVESVRPLSASNLVLPLAGLAATVLALAFGASSRRLAA